MIPATAVDDSVAHPRARTAFILLFALMVVNYLDRQVVVAMFVPLKATWNLQDSDLGLLSAVTSIVIAFGAVPLALLAERWTRVRAIATMAIVWSIATVASAFAPSYAMLLGARALVGLGEATFGAVGVALLATLYPHRARSTVLGAFFVASIVGTTLGIGGGGIVVHHWGWRATFLTAGLPGIALAVVFMAAMRRYRETGAVAGAGVPAPAVRAVLAAAVRPRTVPLVCAGSALQLLTVSMIYAWVPTYLARYHGLDVRGAGLAAGILVVASGVGVLASSALADRLGRRVPSARVFVPALGASLTFAIFTPTFALVPAGTAQFVLMTIGSIVMMSSVGPGAAVVQDVVPERVRATAAAVQAMVLNLVGLAGGAALTGALSDRVGLQAALALVPIASLAAALCFALARRTYADDASRAMTDPAWRGSIEVPPACANSMR